jgi:hypothetical protein
MTMTRTAFADYTFADQMIQASFVGSINKFFLADVSSQVPGFEIASIDPDHTVDMDRVRQRTPYSGRGSGAGLIG